MCMMYARRLGTAYVVWSCTSMGWLMVIYSIKCKCNKIPERILSENFMHYALVGRTDAGPYSHTAFLFCCTGWLSDDCSCHMRAGIFMEPKQKNVGISMETLTGRCKVKAPYGL